MRVLHVYSGNLYGGIEALLVTMARHRALCPDLEPHFALCFEGRLSGKLDNLDVLVHRLGPVRVSRPWTIWQARRRLRELLRREKFDAVLTHSCWPHAVFGATARSAGARLVFWAHDRLSGRHWLERWASRCPPDLVVANSEFTESSVAAVFPGVPSEVIACPVAEPKTSQKGDRREQLRQALGTPDDAVAIVQASRLEPWKGQSILIAALGRLASVPSWECWIVGGAQRPREAAYLRGLQNQARSLGIADRVRFLGERADARDLMAAADVHCQPNLGPEPFGIAFAEAMYAALPVVTTCLGAAPEVVGEECGVFVPPGDDQALAAALLSLIQNRALRRELGAGGPDRARAMCDPGRQLARLHDALIDPSEVKILV